MRSITLWKVDKRKIMCLEKREQGKGVTNRTTKKKGFQTIDYVVHT